MAGTISKIMPSHLQEISQSAVGSIPDHVTSYVPHSKTRTLLSTMAEGNPAPAKIANVSTAGSSSIQHSIASASIKQEPGEPSEVKVEKTQSSYGLSHHEGDSKAHEDLQKMTGLNLTEFLNQLDDYSPTVISLTFVCSNFNCTGEGCKIA